MGTAKRGLTMVTGGSGGAGVLMKMGQRYRACRAVLGQPFRKTVLAAIIGAITLSVPCVFVPEQGVAFTWGYPPDSPVGQCLANRVVPTKIFPDRASAEAAVQQDCRCFTPQGTCDGTLCSCFNINSHRFYDTRTGRYLTPDPIGLAGGINPFVYVDGNPVNLVDPPALYDENVHYHKTLDWGIKVGIESRIAEGIASANQRTDDAFLTTPLYPWNWFLGLSFHFQSTKYAEVGLAQSIEQGNIEQFGKFLHILQDSFSHAGYGFPLWACFLGT